jgi:hypothetical protein
MFSDFKKKITFASSQFRGVAQLASVLAWGASGRPFESDHPDFFEIIQKQKLVNRRIYGLFIFF